MMIDTQVFRSSIATASHLALAAVETGGDRIKALPGPVLVRARAFSANCQYGSIHAPESMPGAQDPGLYVTPELKAAQQVTDNIDLPQPMPMVPTSVIYPKGYQDSGGAEVVNMVADFAYDVGRSIKLEDVQGVHRACRITSSGNMTASAWTSFGTGGYAFQGNPNKKYAIVGVESIAANAIAVRFTHSDFQGLHPGARANSDVSFGRVKFPYCPVFSGVEPLQIEGLNSAAETQTAIVYMVEFDG